MVSDGNVRFGGGTSAVEDGVTRFGDVYCEAVGTTILNSVVDGLADTCRGGGEVADIIRKLDGGDWKVVEVGGSQFERKAEMRSAMNRLKRRGERGSPGRRSTLEEKDSPNLIREDVLAYVCSTSLQNFGPRPLRTNLRKRSGRLTLS